MEVFYCVLYTECRLREVLYSVINKFIPLYIAPDSDDLFCPSVDNVDDTDDEETINNEESLATEVHCCIIDNSL